MTTKTGGDGTSGTNSVWKPTGVQGLYLHAPSGVYYHRYRLNKKRTFRSLKTTTFSVAKIRLTAKAATVEKSRQTTVSTTEAVRTLGDLAKIFIGRVTASDLGKSSRSNYGLRLARLEKHWPLGVAFGKSLPSVVTLDVVIALRTNLKQAGHKSHNGLVEKKGYAPSTLNQTLSFLASLLRLAQQSNLPVNSPFDAAEDSFQTPIFSKRSSRKPDLPKRADMDRVFAAIEAGPDAATCPAALSDYFQSLARDAGEHARFIAYSGMRLEEANASHFEDFKEGGLLRVRGTKSHSSERLVPVVPALASLMAQIRGRRAAAGLPTEGPILRVGKSIHALDRACKKVGVPKLRHHDLRHYFATVCIESGVDIPTVSRWLGHSDGGPLAMKTYGHLRDEHSLAAAQRVSFTPCKTAQSTSA